MELWTAFVLGLVGSTHCAGMCGPLVLALPAWGEGRRQRLLGRSVYHLGRIATYAALGLVFGLLGKSLALAGFQRWVSIALGCLLLLGLLSPRFGRLNLLLKPTIGWLKTGWGRLLPRRTLGSHFLCGGLNGLLPCGLVYVACAGAAGTGSVLTGVQYMLAFGLGTVPMMLGLGLAGALLHTSLRLRLQRLVPMCLAAMALLLILRGMGLGIPYLSPAWSDSAPDGVRCH